MGKGDRYRPSSTTRQEYNLRCLYAAGQLTFNQYEERYKILMKCGLIRRNGRVIK